jgi:hypothetical protein
MRNLLTFHVKFLASVIAHAAKKNSKRRHVNHLFLNGFVPILAQFGAMVFAARFGAFGARRNNELKLYIGELYRCLQRLLSHRTRPFPQWCPAGGGPTLPEQQCNQGAR